MDILLLLKIIYSYILIFLFTLPGFLVYNILSEDDKNGYFEKIPVYFILSLFCFGIIFIIGAFLKVRPRPFINVLIGFQTIALFYILFSNKIRNIFLSQFNYKSILISILLSFISIFYAHNFIKIWPDTIDHLGKIEFFAKNSLDVTRNWGKFNPEGIRLEIFYPLISYIYKTAKLSLFDSYYYSAGWLLWLAFYSWYLLSGLFFKKKIHRVLVVFIFIVYNFLLKYEGHLALFVYDNKSVLYVILPMVTYFLALYLVYDSNTKNAFFLLCSFIVLSLYHKANYIHMVIITLVSSSVYIIINYIKNKFNWKKHYIFLSGIGIVQLLTVYIIFDNYLGSIWHNTYSEKLPLVILLITLFVLLLYIVLLNKSKIRNNKYIINLHKSAILPIILVLIPMVFLILADYKSNVYKKKITANSASILIGDKYNIVNPKMLQIVDWFFIVIAIGGLWIIDNKKKKRMAIFFTSFFVGGFLLMFFPPLSELLLKKIPLWVLDRMREYFYPLSYFIYGVLTIKILNSFNKKHIKIGGFIIALAIPLLLFNGNINSKWIKNRFLEKEKKREGIKNSYEKMFKDKNQILSIFKENKGITQICSNTPRLYVDYWQSIFHHPINFIRANKFINDSFTSLEENLISRYNYYWVILGEDRGYLYKNIRNVFQVLTEYKYSIMFHDGTDLFIINESLVPENRKNLRLFFMEYLKKNTTIYGNAPKEGDIAGAKHIKYIRDMNYIIKMKSDPELFIKNSYYMIALGENNNFFLRNFSEYMYRIVTLNYKIIYHSGKTIIIEKQ